MNAPSIPLPGGLFTFHHVGYATGSIEETAGGLALFGYLLCATPVKDPLQQARIALLDHATLPAIELIEPLTANSPVHNTLSREGVTPYHLGFAVTDLAQAVDLLLARDFVLVQTPTPAQAFEQRSICFLYHRAIGLVELVEQKEGQERKTG
jgi:methylmalonyl-CoA/ethylmalonyl-CoA epimerase